MFSIITCGGNVFAADQKVIEFKKFLFRTKALQNQENKKLQPKKLI